MAKNEFSMKLDKKKVTEMIEELIKAQKLAISTQKDADRLGKDVIKSMKELIGSGVSPIAGKKFPGYKDSYKAAIKGNRYDGLGKYVTPVNLKLTGEFLKNLTFRVLDSGPNKVPEVGFFDNESQLKEKGHREGANSQKKRPIIPQGDERVAQTIKKTLVDHYKKLMVEAIKQVIDKKR